MDGAISIIADSLAVPLVSPGFLAEEIGKHILEIDAHLFDSGVGGDLERRRAVFDVQFDDAVHEFEKRFITRVLGRCDGSLTKAADALGIHRNTLTRKMGEYKIKRRVG